MHTTNARVNEHPAIAAWRTLHAGAAPSRRIDTLQKTSRSAVYRLHGAGPDDTTVIAKRSRSAGAHVELEISLQVLPLLPVASARCFGGFADPGSGEVWLFIEDLGAEPTIGTLETHSALATDWLASMHVSAHRLDEARRLPARGVTHYRDRLERSIDALTARDDGSMRSGDRRRILAVVATCHDVADEWPAIATACTRMPSTLTHGDFVDENLRLHADGRSSPSVIAFDWEKAGWAVPAVDLAKIDVARYAARVRQEWPHISGEDVEAVAFCGQLFRPLVHNWARKPTRELESYANRMRTALVSLTDRSSRR